MIYIVEIKNTLKPNASKRDLERTEKRLNRALTHEFVINPCNEHNQHARIVLATTKIRAN